MTLPITTGKICLQLANNTDIGRVTPTPWTKGPPQPSPVGTELEPLPHQEDSTSTDAGNSDGETDTNPTPDAVPASEQKGEELMWFADSADCLICAGRNLVSFGEIDSAAFIMNFSLQFIIGDAGKCVSVIIPPSLCLAQLTCPGGLLVIWLSGDFHHVPYYLSLAFITVIVL